MSCPLTLEGTLTKDSSSFLYPEAWEGGQEGGFGVEKQQVLSQSRENVFKVSPSFPHQEVSTEVSEEDLWQGLRQRNPGMKVPGLEKQIHKEHNQPLGSKSLTETPFRYWYLGCAPNVWGGQRPTS